MTQTSLSSKINQSINVKPHYLDLFVFLLQFLVIYLKKKNVYALLGKSLANEIDFTHVISMIFSLSLIGHLIFRVFYKCHGKLSHRRASHMYY